MQSAQTLRERALADEKKAQVAAHSAAPLAVASQTAQNTLAGANMQLLCVQKKHADGGSPPSVLGAAACQSQAAARTPRCMRATAEAGRAATEGRTSHRGPVRATKRGEAMRDATRACGVNAQCKQAVGQAGAALGAQETRLVELRRELAAGIA